MITLREGLALSPGQTDQLTKIQSLFRDRASADQARHRAKAADLIKAAEQREKEKIKAINAVLDDVQ